MPDERRDSASLEQIKDAFRLNISSLDKMLAVVTGEYHAPTLPGEPDKITKSIGEAGYHPVTRERELRAPERRETHPIYREVTSSVSAPAVPTKYAQLVKELDRFQFAEDEEKRNRQMEAVIGAIRTSLQDLVIKDVANNTKKAFGEYVKEVFKVGGGIKINFDFSGTKISVSARGAFAGDETVCVSRQGEKIVASVLRIDDNGKTDLTSNFGITMGE